MMEVDGDVWDEICGDWSKEDIWGENEGKCFIEYKKSEVTLEMLSLAQGNIFS